jgi:adenosylcobyric acid synthase
MRERGFAGRVRELAEDGAAVVGICGGYQMLGDVILDPQGIESAEPRTRGLELLPVTTVFEGAKETSRVTGEVTGSSGLLQGAAGTALDGYEIHMGRTATSPGSRRPVGNGPFLLKERSGCPVRHVDGAVDSRGMVLGTYIHGLFYNRGVRASVLAALADRKGVSLPGSREDALHSIDAEYDKLAALVRSSLRMDLVYHSMGLEPPLVDREPAPSSQA